MAIVHIAFVQAEKALGRIMPPYNNLTQVKKQAAEYLKAKFKAHDIHMISAFLWRHLLMLSEIDRREVLKNVGQ